MGICGTGVPYLTTKKQGGVMDWIIKEKKRNIYYPQVMLTNQERYTIPRYPVPVS